MKTSPVQAWLALFVLQSVVVFCGLAFSVLPSRDILDADDVTRPTKQKKGIVKDLKEDQEAVKEMRESERVKDLVDPDTLAYMVDQEMLKDMSNHVARLVKLLEPEVARMIQDISVRKRSNGMVDILVQMPEGLLVRG